MSKLPTHAPLPRNAPCPCKSGKRFKHCHGAHPRAMSDAMERDVREHLRRHEAKEMLRKRQQGYGRPMVTFSNANTRFVAVGKRVAWSPNWRYFSDFLVDNLKTVLGREWGMSASKSMPDHPLFRWLRRLQEARRGVAAGKSIPIRGHLSALNRLGYALYLIEHNDKPPKSLVKRLRKPTEFDPACYEAIVESAFALAGASVVGAEDTRGNQARKPEFFATFKGGKTYAVEAKRKRSWRATFDTDSEEFVAELRSWLRDQLHKASSKKLVNPVYWFELGIGDGLNAENAERLRRSIGDAIDDAESITVEGHPPQSAYVVVTNNADFANDDATAMAQFALFSGFCMEDFREASVEIETAMDWHDKHRAIRRVLECLLEVQQVPTSFDGVPDALLDSTGTPIDTVKIGDRMAYPRKDGSDGVGLIEEITAMDREAYVIIADEATEERVIISMPLTEQEADAAKKYGNAIFGKPEGPHENITDPLLFYDRMLEIYRDYSHESLLNQIGDHRRKEEFRKLSRGDLLIRVAREITKAIEHANARTK